MRKWLEEMIKDCKKGMKESRNTEYWFGRLTAFKEVLRRFIYKGKK